MARSLARERGNGAGGDGDRGRRNGFTGGTEQQRPNGEQGPTWDRALRMAGAVTRRSHVGPPSSVRLRCSVSPVNPFPPSPLSPSPSVSVPSVVSERPSHRPVNAPLRNSSVIVHREPEQPHHGAVLAKGSRERRGREPRQRGRSGRGRGNGFTGGTEQRRRTENKARHGTGSSAWQALSRAGPMSGRLPPFVSVAPFLL